MKLAGIHPILNIQKGRVDLLNSKLRGEVIGPKAKDIQYIKRDDLAESYLSQAANFRTLVKNAQVLIIDSYSELTDQVFVHRDLKSVRFNANYSDVSADAKADYICEGLLDSSKISTLYREFFDLTLSLNPKLKIIYIFFPVNLDNREKFHLQNTKIKEAIYSLETQFQLNLIEVPDALVEKYPEDDFPYHYGSKTYDYVSGQLKLLLTH